MGVREMMRFYAVFVAFLLLAGGASAQTIDPIEYLTQLNCYPPTALLIRQWCARQAPSSVATYRKMDRGHDSAADGFQYSDAVLRSDGWIQQIFDFGYGSGSFGRYDKAIGDGGQLIKVQGGGGNATGYGNIARVVFTEDGGGSRQWFCGDNWWLFDDRVTASWREARILLSISHDGVNCPGFGMSYTRWRRIAAAPFPVIVYDANPLGRADWWNFDVIVSEHYAGGSNVDTSLSMERFWFARDFGQIRWEAWSKSLPNADLGQRCPHVAGSDSPGSGWNLADCHTWTNFKWLSPGWTVDTFGWPLGGVL
jgi:hypothetical protein